MFQSNVPFIFQDFTSPGAKKYFLMLYAHFRSSCCGDGDGKLWPMVLRNFLQNLKFFWKKSRSEKPAFCRIFDAPHPLLVQEMQFQRLPPIMSHPHLPFIFQIFLSSGMKNLNFDTKSGFFGPVVGVTATIDPQNVTNGVPKLSEKKKNLESSDKKPAL